MNKKDIGQSFLIVLIILAIFIVSDKVVDINTQWHEKDALLAENEVLIADLNNHTQELLQINLELTELADIQHEVIIMSHDVVVLLQEEIIQKDLRIDELEREKNEMMKLLGYDEESTITKEEFEILEKITEAEATGKTFEQKRNVVWTILNRISSGSFPDTIEDVVFQKNAYSPVYDGRYESVKVSNQTTFAVIDALNGVGRHEGTFFMNRNGASEKNQAWFDSKLIWLFDDGSGHEYFREG